MRVMRAGAGFALVALLALVAEGDVSGVANSRAVGGAEVGAAAQTSSARGFRYSQWLQDKDAYSTPTLLTDTASSALDKPGSFWGDVAGRLRAGAVDRARDSLINAAYRGESLAELMLRHHRGGEFDMREWLEINRRQVGDRIGAILPAFYRDAEGVLAGALSDAAAELAFVERARISFETALGGRKATGGVEAAGALAQRESYVVGWQLRAFAGEDSAKGLNSGLFYRRVVNDLGFFDDSLAGVNLFLDFEDGDLGDFWRWSIGGDLKSYLGELSANRYFAITDAQKDARGNDVYTREGYDFDFALNIPRVEWAKARVGYYNFEGEFGDEDDSGLRAGLDLHPGHGLVVGLQYDDNGGEFGGNVSYTHKFGEAAAGASRPAEFDPRAHFFDTVRREYSQRITRAGTGNNNIVIVSANVDSVSVSGNVPFGVVSNTVTIMATGFTGIPATGTVINFGFPLAASNSVTVVTGDGQEGTLAIRRGSRWFLTLYRNTRIALNTDVSSAVSVTLSVARGSGILDRNNGMSVVQFSNGDLITLVGTRLRFASNSEVTLYEGEVIIPSDSFNIVVGDNASVRIGSASAAIIDCANIPASGVELHCEIENATVSHADNVVIIRNAGSPKILGTISLAQGGDAAISVVFNMAGFTAAPVGGGNALREIRVNPNDVVAGQGRVAVNATVLGDDDSRTPRVFNFGLDVNPPLAISPVNNIRAAVPQSVTTGIGQVRLSGGGASGYTYSASGSGVAGANVVIDGASGNLSVVAGSALGNFVIVVTGNDNHPDTNPVMLTFTVAIVEALNLRFEGVASPVVVTTGNGVNAGADIGEVVAQSPNAVSQLRVFSGGQYVNLTRNGDRGALRYIGNTANPVDGAQVVIEARDAEDTARITLLLNIVNPPGVALNYVGSPRLTRGTVDAAITAATLAASGGFALDNREPTARLAANPQNAFTFANNVLVLRGPNTAGRTLAAVIVAEDAHRGARAATLTVQVAVSPLELRAGADFVAVKVPRAVADGRLNLFTVRALGGSGARVLGAVGAPFVFANPDAEGAREVYLPAGAYPANLGNAPASVWSFAVRQPGGEPIQRLVTVLWARELNIVAEPSDPVVRPQTVSVNADVIAGAAGRLEGGVGVPTFAEKAANVSLLNPPAGWRYDAGSGFIIGNFPTPGVKRAVLTLVYDDSFNGNPVPQTAPATAIFTAQVTVYDDLAFSAITVTVTAGALAPARRIISGGVAPYTILWGGQGNSEVSIGGGASIVSRDQRGETETITEDNFAAPFYPDTFMQMDAEGYLHVRGVSDSETRAGNNVTERITVRDAAANEMVADVVVRYVDTIPALGMNLAPAVTVYRVGEEFKAADINFTGGAQVAGAGDFAAARVSVSGEDDMIVTLTTNTGSTVTIYAVSVVGNELRANGIAPGTVTAHVIGSNFKDTLTSAITVEFVAPLAITYPSIDIIRTVIVDANAPATPPGPSRDNPRTMPPDLQLSVVTVAAALGDGAVLQLQVGNVPDMMTLAASGGGGATPAYTFTPSGAFGNGGALGVVSFTPTAPGGYRGQVIVANTHNGYTQRVTSVVNISIEAVPAAPRKSLYARFADDLPANARSRPVGLAEVTVGTLAVFGSGVGGEIGLDTLPNGFSADPIADGITLTFNTPANFGGNTNIPVNTQPEIEASAFVLKHSGAAPANDVAIVATTDTQNVTPGTLFVRLRAGALLLTSTGEPVFYLIDNMRNEGHRVFSITAMGGLPPYKFEGIAAANPFAQVHSSEGVNARTLRLYNGAISDSFQTSTNPEQLVRANTRQFEVSDAAGMSATLSAPVFFVKPIRAQVRGGYGALLKGVSSREMAAEIEPNDGAGFYTYQVMSDYPAGYFTMSEGTLMARIPASDTRPLFIVTVRVDDRFRDHFDALDTGVPRADRPLYSVDATPPVDVKVSVYASNPLLAPAATVTVHTRAIAAGSGGIVRPSGGYGPYQLNVSPNTGGNIGSGGLLAINNTDSNTFGDTGINFVSPATTQASEGVVEAGEVAIIDFGGLENGDNDILLITQTTTITTFVSYVHPPQMSIAAHDIVAKAGVEFGVNVRVLGGGANKSIARVVGISGGTIISAPRIVGGGVRATLRGDSEGELLLTVRVSDAHPAINDLDVVLRARIVSGLGLEVLPFALPSAGQLFTVSLNVRGGESRVVNYVSNPGNNGSFVRYDFNGAVVLRAGSAGNMQIVVQVSDETPAAPIRRTIAARVLDGFHFTNQRSAPIMVTIPPSGTNFQLPHLQFAAVGRAGSPSYDIPEILVTNNVINPGSGPNQVVFTAAARYSLSDSGVLSYIGANPPIFPTDDQVILSAQSAGQTALGVITVRYVYPPAVSVAFADPRQTLRFAQRGGVINIGNISIGGGWAPTRQLHLVGASDFSLVPTGGNVALRLGGDNSRARIAQVVIRGTDGHHGSYDGFMTARVTVDNLPVSVRLSGGNLYQPPGAGALQIGTLIVDGGIGGGYALAAANGFTYTPLTVKVTGESFVTREVSVGVARHPDTNQNVPIYENRAFPVTANKHAFAVQLNAPNTDARTVVQVFRGSDSNNATPDGMLTLTIIVKQPQAFMRIDGFNGNQVNNTAALSIGAIVASSDIAPLRAEFLSSSPGASYRISGGVGAQVLYLRGPAGVHETTLRATDNDPRTADGFLTVRVTLRNELTGPNRAVVLSPSPENLDVITVTVHSNSNAELTVLRDSGKVGFLQMGFPHKTSFVVVTTANDYGGRQLSTMTVVGNESILPGAVIFRILPEKMADVARQSAADRTYLYTLQYPGVDDKVLTIVALPLVASLPYLQRVTLEGNVYYARIPLPVGENFRRTISVSGVDAGPYTFQRQGNASWNVDSNGVISGNFATPGAITGTVRVDDGNPEYAPIDLVFALTADVQAQALTVTAYTKRAAAGVAASLGSPSYSFTIQGPYVETTRTLPVTIYDERGRIKSVQNVITRYRARMNTPMEVANEYRFAAPNNALHINAQGGLFFKDGAAPASPALVTVDEQVTYGDADGNYGAANIVVQYVNAPQVMVTAQQLANALTLRRVPTLTTGVPNLGGGQEVTVDYGFRAPHNAVAVINFNDGNRRVDVVHPAGNGAQAVMSGRNATIYLNPADPAVTVGMLTVTVVTYDEYRPESGTVESRFVVDLRTELRMTAFDDGVAFTYENSDILYSYGGNFNVVRGGAQEVSPRGLPLLAYERTNSGNLVNELPVLLEVTGGNGNVTYENPGNGFTWNGGILRYADNTFGALHTAAVTITNVNEVPGSGEVTTEVGVYYTPRAFVTLVARSGVDFIRRVATVHFRTRPGAARPPATAPTPPVTVSYDYNDILVAAPRQFFGAGESDVAVATVNVASGVTPRTDSRGFRISTAEGPPPQEMTLTTRVEFTYQLMSPIFGNIDLDVRTTSSIVITVAAGQTNVTVNRAIGAELQATQGNRFAEIIATRTPSQRVGNNYQIPLGALNLTLTPYPALAAGGDTHLLLFTDADAAVGAHYATVTADDTGNADTAPGTVYATLTLAPHITPLTATVTVVQGSQSRGIVGTLRAQGGTPPYGFIPQGLDLINAEVQPLGPASLRAVGIKSDGEIHLLANPNLQTPGLFTLASVEISDNTPAPYNTRKATAQMLLLSVAPPLQITASYSNPGNNRAVVVAALSEGNRAGNVAFSVLGYSPAALSVGAGANLLTVRSSQPALARITVIVAESGYPHTLTLQLNRPALTIAEYLMPSAVISVMITADTNRATLFDVDLVGAPLPSPAYRFNIECSSCPANTNLHLVTVGLSRKVAVESALNTSSPFMGRIHARHLGYASNAPGQFFTTRQFTMQIAQPAAMPLSASLLDTINFTVTVDRGDDFTAKTGSPTENSPTKQRVTYAQVQGMGGTPPYIFEVRHGRRWYADTRFGARGFPGWIEFRKIDNYGELRSGAYIPPTTDTARNVIIRVRDSSTPRQESRLTIRVLLRD